ncbi:hypothetical protein [Algoriphagus boritolerans]|uniref:GHMP family kinase ATP-binding protein n=1 Tax=Algoriphagus boritolerans TaxID=308111 RepID=UPI002FCE429D
MHSLRKKGHWATYVMGMVALLKQAGYSISGFDMVIGGNIPVGSGLSSSAALSVAIGTAISGLFDFKISKKIHCTLRTKIRASFCRCKMRNNGPVCFCIWKKKIGHCFSTVDPILTWKSLLSLEIIR